MARQLRMYFRVLGLRGLWYFIKAKVKKDTVLFEVNRGDCKHPFFLRIPTSDVLTYEQIFLHGEYGCDVKHPPQVIVNAGANMGASAIYFANKYPDAQIIAIEPEQSNFELLKKNVAPYPYIVPLQVALWHKNEEINLIDPSRDKWGFITEVKSVTNTVSARVCHSVMGVTLGKLIKDFGISKIDILKVDIEGAEKEVFSDTSAWIGQVESIIIELHERKKVGCNHSFYSGAIGFDTQWSQGENACLAKGEYLSRSFAQ